MANTVSAAKRHRQSLKRKLRNTYVKAEFRAALKVAREATASGDAAKAKDAVKAATRLIDRAASKGVLHSKSASRLVARMGHNLSVKSAAKPAAK
ncbi:MAG: 30S ribosomal protein S20 [Myxococcus sp.]|nr:30S ribosomal protein S20 [Myxococcus sp.]